MKLLKFSKNSSLNKKSNFETKIIKLISILLIFLFLSVIFLYYSSLKSMYSEQLERSNDNIIEQVAISFETITNQITEGIYKIPLNDEEMIQMIKSNNQDMLYQMQLQKKLDNIVLGNSYLISCYLYLPDHNVVYSTHSANSYTLENFPDRSAIILKRSGVISIIAPRIVESLDSSQGMQLLISVVCPIPLYQGEYEGLLVVNINAKKLYYDILKKIKTDKNMNFYVYNEENIMVINKDSSLISQKYVPEEKKSGSIDFLAYLKNVITQKKCITSSYYSQALDWNFVLETSINSTSSFLTKLFSIITALIILLFFGLVTIILIIKFSTKPMKKALDSYNNKLLIDFITNHNIDLDELEKHLPIMSNHYLYNSFAIILIQFSKIDIAQDTYLACINSIHSLKSVFVDNIVGINQNHIAILVNFEHTIDHQTMDDQLVEFSTVLYNKLDQDIKPLTYISISTLKEGFKTLPMSYKECIEIVNYKIILNSHILLYSNIKGVDQKMTFEYPYELEKQLINNLIVENLEACNIFLEKFFAKLTDPLFFISDSEIKIYIYQLQSSILKRISCLPISIKIDLNLNILNLYDFNEIKENISNLIVKTHSLLCKEEDNKESNFIKSIFEYIDKRYTNEDFNLNSIAYELNLDRHYIGKIIKEKTGDSFSEYINKKRVSFAKELIYDKKMSIDQVAHKAGFNYPHYFIRMFKTLEGITPGQYRDRIIEFNSENDEKY